MAVIYQNFRGVQFDTGQTMTGAVCESSPSVTYNTGSVSASTDPFTSKTNKYAESKIVRIMATAFGHVKFSAAGTAATTDHFPIAANTEYFFVVASGGEFLRVIPTTGSATFYVTEIY